MFLLLGGAEFLTCLTGQFRLHLFGLFQFFGDDLSIIADDDRVVLHHGVVQDTLVFLFHQADQGDVTLFQLLGCLLNQRCAFIPLDGFLGVPKHRTGSAAQQHADRAAQQADQAAIDAHHASPMMGQIAALREKYDLHMKVERFVSDDSGLPEKDMKFIKQ